MRALTVPYIDLKAIDAALLEGDRLRVMPAKELLSFGLPTLQSWMVQRARYQLVTRELVEWLHDRIGRRDALEIGAGMGDLGFHVQVHMTDLGQQANHALFVEMGQEPTKPPPDVERIDAEQAVEKYRPSVVIGSWITQRWHEGDTEGAVYGPEEARILSKVKTYIHIGNSLTHGRKRILRFKHREYRPEGLISRSVDQSKNVIYVWDR